jgi:hypothetical protein
MFGETTQSPLKAMGVVWTIELTKHWDNNTKCLKVLLCYDLMKGIKMKKKYFSLLQNQICLRLEPSPL